jgi:hypothetical protein
MSNKLFNFDTRCSELKLTHLCFADDLIIFAFANLKTVATIQSVLDAYARLLGLSTNPSDVNQLIQNTGMDRLAVSSKPGTPKTQ